MFDIATGEKSLSKIVASFIIEWDILRLSAEPGEYKSPGASQWPIERT
jgi:hypothetical protein